MIDGRTDMIQSYSQWIENRFNEGFLYSRNPACPSTVQKIFLDKEHVDAIVFTSKNYKPGLDFIKKIDRKFPCLYHYTITAYGKDIEPGVPFIDESIDTLFELCNIVGFERIFWRYDPVLLTDKYSLEYHVEIFNYISKKIGDYINRCIYSYVNLYEKTKRHMPELVPWTDEKKIEVAKTLGPIAKKNNVLIQTCNCNLDLTEYGVGKSGCVTKELFNSILGLNLKDKRPNGTLGCTHCYPIVNIGEYNTCLNKCRYCYASSDFEACEKNYAHHNPDSPYLIGSGTPMDNIVERKSDTVLSKELNLFD